MVKMVMVMMKMVMMVMMKMMIFTKIWDPSKVRLPKSTENLRHHTESHFRSDT